MNQETKIQRKDGEWKRDGDRLSFTKFFISVIITTYQYDLGEHCTK